MPAMQVAPKLLSWASEVDEGTILQAAKTARLPIVVGHVALMPDAHVGIGSTVGSVIPTENAIIPAAVGVDIGCGMVATETILTAAELPDNLDRLLPTIAARIPAGVGKGHKYGSGSVDRRFDELGGLHTALTAKQRETAALQFGTLGSGNHFVEICLDERDRVWTVLHSGSRGIGYQLAQKHIALARQQGQALEDRDLAYFLQGTPEFLAYITDMTWAQRYARASRQAMADQLNRTLLEACGFRPDVIVRIINCHHNFTQLEEHDGRKLWVTRKGAIKADRGDEGVIPGSMGTRSYIVSGLGNPASFNSCSHGAGRRLSRGAAKRQLDVVSFEQAMAGKTWQAGQAEQLLDEHPQAYKDIDQVMADQADLVQVQHTLRQVLNFKGL